MEKKCVVCGTLFSPPTYESVRGGAKYCSRKCFGIGIRKRVEVICLQCGKPFFTYPNRPRNNCSIKCGGVARKNKKIVKCLICGKEFLSRPDNIKKGEGKFCSRMCYGKWESINRTGEKSATWKGGITPIRELIRNSRQYREWRNSVITRDGKCIKCGNKENLVAHHKKRFSHHIQRIVDKMPLLSIYEASMIYKPLWDISNGETLCEPCHKKEHGWKSNTIPDKPSAEGK